MPQDLEVTFRPESDGYSTRADLWLNGESASRLWVIPFTIRVGAATVRMDGIGGVGTPEEHRNKGYSRRVLEATVEHMKQGDAALSMLYGIPDYYPKFGYATAGPDHYIQLKALDENAALPGGWTARRFQPEDRADLRRIYELNTSSQSGPAERQPERFWDRLMNTLEPNTTDQCRVAVGPEGKVGAYAWWGKGRFWYLDNVLEHDFPEALNIAEVMADGPVSADAILAVLRQWGTEESGQRETPVKRVNLSNPPVGWVASAAMRQPCDFLFKVQPHGGSMARVLNVSRLLNSLRPELNARLHSARIDYQGDLRLHSDLGDVSLRISPSGVTLPEAAKADAPAISLPQHDLARLALGAFPPQEILGRLTSPPDEPVLQALRALFPHHHPHMYVPDRF